MRRKTVLNIPGLVLAIFILACGTLALSGCGSEQGETGAENAGTDTQPARPVVARKGGPAPDFTLRKINGGNLQLSSLQGKAVILDFWDTWCPPCRRAMPHLQELSETYSDDLVVVGVAMGREGEAKVRSYTVNNGLTFEMVMFNNDPNLITAFGGIQSIPTTFLIDREGVIREKWVGGFGKETYEAAVKNVIGS
ncbi:MAG: TlpA disulfide reductase family protein [Candidatus Krumholzibacteriota bacterium]